MSPRICCVPECTVTQNQGIPMHRFPNPNKLDENERFHTWVLKIGGDILGEDNLCIHRNRRICHRHFIEEYIFPNDRLSKLAVPTLNIPGAHSLPSEMQVELDEQQVSTVRSATPEETVEPLIDMLDIFTTSMTNIKPPVKHAASDEQEAAHNHVSCDNCDAKVYGFRYKCVECADYDLCSSCEAGGEHPDHYVLRIPQPLQFGKAQLLIDRIRQSMADEGLCQKQALPQAENLQEIDSKGADNMCPIKVELCEEINLKEQENLLIDAEVNSVLAQTRDPLDVTDDGFSDLINKAKANDAPFVQTLRTNGVTKYANKNKRKFDVDPKVNSVNKNNIYHKKVKTEDFNEPSPLENAQRLQHPHMLQEQCHIIKKIPLSRHNRSGS